MVASDMVFQLGSNLNADNLQFILTCISAGGPATTVIWTRDSQTVSGGMTVFKNAIAQYTHTLTVTGRLGGKYQCNVTNNKPSISVAQLKIQGIAEVYYISYSVQYCYCFAISLSSCLSSHWPHCSSRRSHWYSSLLDPTHSTRGYNWVQDLL